MDLLGQPEAPDATGPAFGARLAGALIGGSSAGEDLGRFARVSLGRCHVVECAVAVLVVVVVPGHEPVHPLADVFKGREAVDREARAVCRVRNSDSE